ncbi:MAG: hypothetical protein LQ350_003875 [Teloschistes chrysophthalmus]|nr:MAG: hypothetical protein LQ350_003875 [Niorma chrysophthalma]
MSVTHPLRCLFAKVPPPPRRPLRRTFHNTTCLHVRPSPKHPSVKASDLGLMKEDGNKRDARLTAKDLPSYSESDKPALAKRYSPAQIAALEAGEAAVDAEDLVEQGAMREDSMRLKYLDDLSKMHPVVDKRVRAPEENYDLNLRFKTEHELLEDVASFMTDGYTSHEKSAEDQEKRKSRLDWIKFMDNNRLTVGKEEAERNPYTYLAPSIPKLKILKPKTRDDDDIDAATRRLMRQTGFDARQIRRFRVKILVTHRVVNQTRLGKIQSIYCLAVAGNGKGLIGIGEGKSAENHEAFTQARNAAVRNMQPIPMYESRTIFGDVKGKVSATEVELMTRPPGFGVRCQSLIFEMCRCAGIQDLAARVSRSRNHMNTVKATLQALLSQRLPEEIARARGRKLVDVRKVYYDGNL